MKRAVLLMSSILGVLATIATLILMIAIVADVVFRTLYERSVPGILELSETTLVAAVFLGMAYTGATNSHIVVDLLTERLPASIRRWVVAVAWTLTVAILVWMLFGTARRALDSTQAGEIRMGIINWPIWPSRWLIVIGLAAMLVVAIVNMVRTWSGKEVLMVEEQMPDFVEHPYEYVTQESAAVSATEAIQLANTEGSEEPAAQEGDK